MPTDLFWERLKNMSLQDIGCLPAPGVRGGNSSEVLYTLIQKIKESEEKIKKLEEESFYNRQRNQRDNT